MLKSFSSYGEALAWALGKEAELAPLGRCKSLRHLCERFSTCIGKHQTAGRYSRASPDQIKKLKRGKVSDVLELPSALDPGGPYQAG